MLQEKSSSEEGVPPVPLPWLLLVLPIASGSQNGLGWVSPQRSPGSGSVGWWLQGQLVSSSELRLCLWAAPNVQLPQSHFAPHLQELPFRGETSGGCCRNQSSVPSEGCSLWMCSHPGKEQNKLGLRAERLDQGKTTQSFSLLLSAATLPRHFEIKCAVPRAAHPEAPGEQCLVPESPGSSRKFQGAGGKVKAAFLPESPSISHSPVHGLIYFNDYQY